MIAFGLVLALLGLALTLDRFGFLPFAWGFLDVVALFGALLVFDRALAGRYFAMVAWAFPTAALGLHRFLPDFDFGDLRRLWPLVLVIVGVSVVVKALRGNRPLVADAAAQRSSLALLSNNRIRIADPSYRGGAAIAILGGHHIDLREAKLADTGAEIEVFALMGGVELIVPRDWSVQLEVVAALGGAEDKTLAPASQSASSPRLIVRGLVVMGGIEAHY
jgi:Cell wall-active antibiotics response 4TMS YvqF